MTKLKEERGITLVALAITVLVLAILAGVTLDTLVGDSGIITKAQEASQNMENASREEDELIQILLYLLVFRFLLHFLLLLLLYHLINFGLTHLLPLTHFPYFVMPLAL